MFNFKKNRKQKLYFPCYIKKKSKEESNANIEKKHFVGKIRTFEI